MLAESVASLWFGFGVALEPHNILWCLIGVLPGLAAAASRTAYNSGRC